MANATMNQFPPAHRVCSHYQEFGDATPVPPPPRGQTAVRPAAALPRALVPVRCWREAPPGSQSPRVRPSCRRGRARSTSLAMPGAGGVLRAARLDLDLDAVDPDRDFARRVLS